MMYVLHFLLMTSGRQRGPVNSVWMWETRNTYLQRHVPPSARRVVHIDSRVFSVFPELELNPRSALFFFFVSFHLEITGFYRTAAAVSGADVIRSWENTPGAYFGLVRGGGIF